MASYSTEVLMEDRESQNKTKIQNLLSHAADVLRNLFLKRWREYTSSEWNCSTVGDYFRVIGWKVLQKLQNRQMDSMLSGDMKQWDITTLTAVLLLTEFPKHLRPSQEERAMLEELKKISDIFAHNPRDSLDDEKFEYLWERTAKFLIFMGYPADELEKLKSSTNLNEFQDENLALVMKEASIKEPMAISLEISTEKTRKIKEFKMICKELEIFEWEMKNGLCAGGMTFEDREARMRTGKINPNSRPYKLCSETVLLGLMPKRHHFDEKMLKKCISLGSMTAARMLKAFHHFRNAVRLLAAVIFGSSSRDREAFGNYKQMVHELANCYRSEPLIKELIHPWKESMYAAILLVFNSTSDSTTSELDKDCRVCIGWFGMDKQLTTLSKRKYPEESAFHFFEIHELGISGMYGTALFMIQESLKLLQNDYNLLYTKARHLTLDGMDQMDDTKRVEIIKAFEEFITVAPKDHEEIPESYFAIASSYLLVGTGGGNPKIKLSSEDLNRVKEYYQRGLEAEKDQLPCFLPYNSPSKAFLEKLLPELKLLKKDNEMDEIAVVEPNYKALTDPNRILMITAHRFHLKEQRKNKGITSGEENLNSRTIGILASSFQQPPGLEPIFFSEMDKNIDKVYEGRMIHVTSIEDPFVRVQDKKIDLILQDEKGDICRATIYNFPEDDSKIIKEKFGFGAKISILNPQMTVEVEAGGNENGIFVDDSASLIFQSASTNCVSRCRFCGNENATYRCKKCKWAEYCGSKCQELDWKLAKHKLICIRF